MKFETDDCEFLNLVIIGLTLSRFVPDVYEYHDFSLFNKTGAW